MILLALCLAAPLPPSAPDPSFFAGHRQRLLSRMGEGAVAVLSGASEPGGSDARSDSFRQGSDFHYLTGLEEPESVAILRHGRYILFVRPRNFAEEQWTGWRAGVEGARSRYGADEAYPLSELGSKLGDLLRGATSLLFVDSGDAGFRARLLGTWWGRGTDSAALRPASDISPLVHELRLRKDETEIAFLRRAAALSAEAHVRAMHEVHPGANEAALKAVMVSTCLAGGAARMAYPPIVGSGPNSVILHYDRDDRELKAGEMVVNDTACEYAMYAGDVTRSYPVSGRFSPEQRSLYEIVLAAQKAGFARVKPGVAYHEIYDATVGVVVDGLLRLGVLQGQREDIIAKRAFMAFYPHGSGHWLGLDVHDAGSYQSDPGSVRPEKYFSARTLLEPGMAITVEPGIYIPETPGVDRRFWNIGVRIEDDVLVTQEGMECLSCGAPREIVEVERALAPVRR